MKIINYISNIAMPLIILLIVVYGIKEKNEPEIIIESKVVETIPFTTKYIKDYKIEDGKEEIIQYGANGAKSETYKIVKKDGIIESRTLISADTYSPLERIVKRSAKEVQGANANPFEDSTSELKDLNSELLERIKELD